MRLGAGIEQRMRSIFAEDAPIGREVMRKEDAIAWFESQADEAQLVAARVKIDQLQAEYNLKISQVDQLKVRARFDGMLQALPAPLTPVEEGQKVTAGTPLGKVAQPSHLKAE